MVCFLASQVVAPHRPPACACGVVRNTTDLITKVPPISSLLPDLYGHRELYGSYPVLKL